MLEKKGVKAEKNPKAREERKQISNGHDTLRDKIQGPESELAEQQYERQPENYGAILLSARSINDLADAALNLQRTHGNACVQRLLNSKAVQAKLTTSQPGDPYEVEAERVAETVTKAGNRKVLRQSPEEEELLQAKAVSHLQLQSEEEEEEEPLQAKYTSQVQLQFAEEEEELQAKTAGEKLVTGDALENRVNASRGLGEPLADSTRKNLEPLFGADFSEVVVHTGGEADTLSRQLNADAFTTGKDIYFKAGRYQPESEAGQKLLAHELTHVIQQRSGEVQTNQSIVRSAMRQGEELSLSISPLPKNSSSKIHRWGGSAHQALTVTATSSIMPQKTALIERLKKACVKMDWRVRRLLGAAIPFVEHLFGAPIAGEGPDHGEDGNYTNPDINACSSANIAVQDQHLNQAIDAKKSFYATTDKSVHKKFFNQVEEHLGDALHIAQDRGSHWEGAKGRGHDDPREKDGKYSTDNPANNSEGYSNAQKNTEDVLKRYEDAK